MTETEIQAQILTYLKYRGILATRNQSGHVQVGRSWINLGASGWPDIIGCLPGGRFLGIEVKQPGGKPSKTQRELMGALEAFGALVIVATDVKDVERGLGNSRPS